MFVVLAIVGMRALVVALALELCAGRPASRTASLTSTERPSAPRIAMASGAWSRAASTTGAWSRAAPK
jgi:hypothetical protein